MREAGDGDLEDGMIASDAGLAQTYTILTVSGC